MISEPWKWCVPESPPCYQEVINLEQGVEAVRWGWKETMDSLSPTQMEQTK